jgi:hypothetical protein
VAYCGWRARPGREFDVFTSLSFVFVFALYFLPTIIGWNKTHKTGIFLVNLFLGWTFIGWVVALFWALSSDRIVPVHYVPVVATAGPFCSRCGRVAVGGAHFCRACGSTV